MKIRCRYCNKSFTICKSNKNFLQDFDCLGKISNFHDICPYCKKITFYEMKFDSFKGEN